ncbi:MAG TPA: hypothetical protein P5543_03765 [Planctomycetota bacterium]|nr:hypothetical protein [Planctomycetota bacterium]
MLWGGNVALGRKCCSGGGNVALGEGSCSEKKFILLDLLKNLSC